MPLRSCFDKCFGNIPIALMNLVRYSLILERSQPERYEMALLIRTALLRARGSCRHKPYCLYTIEYCSDYWHKVFFLMHNEAPKDGPLGTGKYDKRWDALFQIGFQAFRDLEKEDVRKEVAE